MAQTYTFGSAQLIAVKLGKETSWGTAVTPTLLLPVTGMPSFSSGKHLEVIESKQGTIFSAFDTYMVDEGVTGSMEMGFTYERAPNIISAVLGTTTPTDLSSPNGTDWQWAWTLPTSGLPTLQEYTIHYGDNVQTYEVTGAIGSRLSISGSRNELISMSVDWLAKAMATASSTPTLSLADAEAPIFNKGKLYVDAYSGTIGTTQLNATLISFELTIENGAHLKHHADGAIEPTGYGLGPFSATLRLTLEHGTSGKDELAQVLAGNKRLIKIEFPGTALTGGNNKTLEIYFVGAPT